MVDVSNALSLHFHWDLTFLTFLKKQRKSILVFLFVLMCRFQLMRRKSREHRTLMKEVLAADKRYQSQSCWIGFLLFCEVKSWCASQTRALLCLLVNLRSVTAEFCPTLTFTGRLNLLSDQHYIVDKGFQTLSNLISVKSLGVCLIVVCEMILCWCAIIIRICNCKVGGYWYLRRAFYARVNETENLLCLFQAFLFWFFFQKATTWSAYLVFEK